MLTQHKVYFYAGLAYLVSFKVFFSTRNSS